MKNSVLKDIDKTSGNELAYVTLDGKLYGVSGHEFDIKAEEFLSDYQR